jgi:transcriptional regulator with XRE-family HTH domain
MKHLSSTEKLFLDEVSTAAKHLIHTVRKLHIGEFIKTIRKQLRMTQATLAKRANLPQSTISRIEKEITDPSLSSLVAIFEALHCELVVAPALKESIDSLCRKQARKIALQRVQYLRGTMNLEDQEPDKRLIEELIKKETEALLHNPSAKLWDE